MINYIVWVTAKHTFCRILCASRPGYQHSHAYILDKIAPLLFDTLVTAITVWKAFHIRIRNGGASSKLIQTFLREGK